MDLKSSDLVQIVNSPIALSLLITAVLIWVVMPLNNNIQEVVTEFKTLNSNVTDLTKTVKRHEILLSDLSNKVDNLSKGKKQ
jgi:hypothetical protein